MWTLPAMSKIAEITHTKSLVIDGVLTAPDGFMEAGADVLAEICNGCSAAEAKFDFVPDTIYGLCICPVCHLHDYEYHTGKTDDDKDRADDRFLINGINLIEAKSNWFMRILRRRRMLKYYEAVTAFGDDAFWAGK